MACLVTGVREQLGVDLFRIDQFEGEAVHLNDTSTCGIVAQVGK